MYADVFHELSERLNFTFEVESGKSGFGVIRDGEWVGMIGWYQFVIIILSILTIIWQMMLILHLNNSA